jgi:hypothetical protein
LLSSNRFICSRFGHSISSLSVDTRVVGSRLRRILHS